MVPKTPAPTSEKIPATANSSPPLLRSLFALIPTPVHPMNETHPHTSPQVARILIHSIRIYQDPHFS